MWRIVLVKIPTSINFMKLIEVGEMFLIKSAQDREARNFTSTGVINLNNIYRVIFQYLKNLYKTEIVARREGR